MRTLHDILASEVALAYPLPEVIDEDFGADDNVIEFKQEEIDA